jgi:hypothetical protein
MNIEELKKEMIRLGSGVETLELEIRAKFRCEYCECNFYSSIDNYYSSIQWDHIIPRSAKGTNDTENNIAIVCRTCNMIKGRYNPLKHNSISTSREELILLCKAEVLRRRKTIELRMNNRKKISEKILELLEFGEIKNVELISVNKLEFQ